jgi:TRAP-type C4-dicarboxylate transport system substrate-binding protein
VILCEKVGLKVSDSKLRGGEQMKKETCLSSLAAAVLIVTVLLSAWAAPAPGAEPIKLSWSIAWPSTNVVNKYLAPWYKDEIEKRTNGRVKITIYHAGQLLKPAETYEGVVRGVAHMGTSRIAYGKGRFRVGCAYEMPGISYNNAYVSNLVSWELYKKFEPKEFASTHMLWIDSTGPGMLYTKMPVTRLEDIQGKSLRGDALVLDALKALGANADSMPMGDVYLALEKGLLQGTLARFGALVEWKLAEVTKYIVIAPFIYTSAVFFNTMNLDTWNSLPRDIRKVFDEIGDEAVIKSAKIFEENEAAGLAFGVEKHGMQIIRLSTTEEERWKQLIKPVQDKWVADMEAIGIPGRKMLDEQIRLVEKYNKEYPHLRGTK